MAINPLLLNVKPISEITTVNNPIEGHLLFYDGSDELKKVDIVEFQSLIGGIAKPLAISDASPTVSGWYKPTTSGTYANAGGLVAQVGYDTLFYFDGTTWSLVSVDVLKFENSEPTSDVILTPNISLNNGFYVSQFNGNDEANPNLSTTNHIPIPQDKRWLKLSYIGDYAPYHQFAFYDINKKFISTQDSINGYTTGEIPKDAFYLRMTLETAFTDKYWVKFSNGNTLATTVNVGKGGFKTIKSAIDSVGGGINEPIIVNLSEGVYDEELKFHNRKITIIGANKNKTIIQGNTGDYYKPAMEVSGEVYFQNITFEETSENVSTPAPAMPAYAVHLDYAGAGTMEFNNCIFKGNSHNTVGIGLHNNQTLRFVNCEFHHTNSIGAGCMFAHNNPFPENGVNQKMEVINCQFYIYGGINIMTLNDAAWTWQDGHKVDNGTTFMFINNTFFSDLGNPTISLHPASFGAGKITGNVKLHPASCGNNIDILNYNV